MKTRIITDNSVEKIEFRAGDEQYDLIHSPKSPSLPGWFAPKAIRMNKRELLTLYQAIQSEILNGKTEPNAVLG